MSKIICFCFFIVFFPVVSAKTKCMKAIGRVECQSDRSKERDVEIFLMDHDSMNPDDTMGFTTSNEDGTFKVEGCGYDLWSNPDPYLKIWSHCGTELGRRVNTPTKQIFLPETADFGVISLE